MEPNASNEEQLDMFDSDDEKIFPFDINIPSIPSIKTLPEPSDNRPGGPMPAYKRRNMVLRMISDPKIYNPKILRSLSIEKRKATQESSENHIVTSNVEQGSASERKLN